MTNKFYKTPSSDPSKNMKENGSSIKAILFGSSFDIGCSIVLSVLIVILYSIFLGFQGLNAEEVTNRLANFDVYSLIGILSMVLGGLISVCAGYICSSKSLYNVYRDSLIVGLISSSLTFSSGSSTMSLTMKVVLALMTIILVLAGAFIWKNKHP